MTKDEKTYQAKVRQVGCIACRIVLKIHSIGEIHHMLSGGRRRGEMFVLSLCPSHHRGGFSGKVSINNPMGIVSRDHSQKRFEKYVGMTEDEMLAYQDNLVRWI